MKLSSSKGSTSSGKAKKSSSLFQRGYEPAREEKHRQDEVREQSSKRLYNLFLKDDGDEATVRFLTEEPVNFYAHNIKTTKGGKEHYDMVACSQDDNCEFCEDGDKPSYKGAYLVYDRRTFEKKDKNGKKVKVKGSIRLYVQGMRIIGQLDRLSSRYGLTKCDYTITRNGTGQSTTYMFDREPESNDKVSKKEIENMLPEKLREMYDGTEESLYRIVEQQIELLLPSEGHDTDSDDDDDDADDEDARRAEKKRRKNLVSYDDDDSEEEDEDEDDKPKKSNTSLKVASGKKSVKSLYRGNK